MYAFLLPAVIEHVRDGCTVRAFLLPSFNYVTVMLSGVKVTDYLSYSCEFVFFFVNKLWSLMICGITQPFKVWYIDLNFLEVVKKKDYQA